MPVINRLRVGVDRKHGHRNQIKKYGDTSPNKHLRHIKKVLAARGIIIGPNVDLSKHK